MTDPLGVPDVEEFDVDVISGFQREDTEHTYNNIDIEIRGETKPVKVVVTGDNDFQTLCWKAVAWCRSYGVPGVWKEQLTIKSSNRTDRFRLGGLYMYLDVDLTKRETNYSEYGENPAHTQDILSILDDS